MSGMVDNGCPWRVAVSVPGVAGAVYSRGSSCFVHRHRGRGRDVMTGVTEDPVAVGGVPPVATAIVGRRSSGTLVYAIGAIT